MSCQKTHYQVGCMGCDRDRYRDQFEMKHTDWLEARTEIDTIKAGLKKLSEEKMKTTKEQRQMYRDGLGNSPLANLLDDIDTLEAKCAWQSEMLERAKCFILDVTHFETAPEWLADLEKGPR